MIELKPCLFCENEDVTLYIDDGYESYVHCNFCGAMGPVIKNKSKEDAKRVAAICWNEIPRKNERFLFPKDANGNQMRLGEDVFDTQTGRKLITQGFELTNFHPSGDLVIRCYDPKRGGETLHHPNKLSLAKQPDEIGSVLDQVKNLQQQLAIIAARIKKLAQSDDE